MQGKVREIAVDVVAADGRRLPMLVNSRADHRRGGRAAGWCARRSSTCASAGPTSGNCWRRGTASARRARPSSACTRRPRRSRTRCSRACWRASRRATSASASRRSTGHRARRWKWAGTGTTRSCSTAAGSALVVGDVVGRGLAAATTMGQLRSATRALAMTGVGPRVVLDQLDTFVEQLEAAQSATLVYAEVDANSGAATVAAAGHLRRCVVSGDKRGCSWAVAPRRSAFARPGCRAATRPSSCARGTDWCSTPTASSNGAARASTPAGAPAGRGHDGRAARGAGRRPPAEGPQRR